MKFYIYGQCEDCQNGFDIFILQTNQSNKNLVRNINVFGSHASNIYTHWLTNNVRDGQTLINRVLQIEANLDTTGLYVAFRDRVFVLTCQKLLCFIQSVIKLPLILVLGLQGCNFQMRMPMVDVLIT